MTETTSPLTLTKEERRQQFIELGWLVPVHTTTVAAHWLSQGENRLDGGFFTTEVNNAVRVINDCGCEQKSIEDLTEPIWYPGRFKRIYAKDPAKGTPFLTASEMLHFRPTSTDFLANNTNAVGICSVQNGWILVTRSGTVGRSVIVKNRLSRFVITDDAIRVQTKGIPAGYLYAYLSSKVGQILISKDQYGSAIKHLEPHHLAGVSVPLLPEETQAEIHDEVMRAYALRDDANDLLDEANRILHDRLGLPLFDESLVPYLSAPALIQTPSNRPIMPHPKAYSINSSELADRLDGSYHVPVARTAIHILKNATYLPKPLASFSKDIFLPGRFKRIYVSKDYGVPFLQGSHLPQMKPYDINYISMKANAKHIDECLVRSGFVLITRSGTIGRIGLVSTYIDKWAASEHLIRIVANPGTSHPGYIAAFLLTPYGQHQLTSKIYGGVVDELTVEDTSGVWIPDAPIEIQKEIGELVVQAFEKKDEATALEAAAIRKVDDFLLKDIAS